VGSVQYDTDGSSISSAQERARSEEWVVSPRKTSKNLCPKLNEVPEAERSEAKGACSETKWPNLKGLGCFRHKNQQEKSAYAPYMYVGL
jgi:hypothetical protein